MIRAEGAGTVSRPGAPMTNTRPSHGRSREIRSDGYRPVTDLPFVRTDFAKGMRGGVGVNNV